MNSYGQDIRNNSYSRLPGVLVFLIVIICFFDRSLALSDDICEPTEYELGNASVIISGGHGGFTGPQERHSQCASNDYITDGCKFKKKPHVVSYIALEMRKYGIYPHVITMNVQGKDFNVNRPIDQACKRNSACERIYRAYHSLIEKARKATKGTVAIYFDIHDQDLPADEIELRYGISKSQLNSGDYKNVRSSINHLKIRSGLSLKELLTGNLSIGHLFSRRVRSPQETVPGRLYHGGGYSIQVYGSQKGENCTDAIQIDISNSFAKGDKPTFQTTVKDLAFVLTSFVKKNKYDDPSWKCGASKQSAEGKILVLLMLVVAYLCKYEY